MNTKRRTAQNLEPAQVQKHIADMLAKSEQFDTVQPLWEDYVTGLARNSAKIEVDELVQSVLNQAYLQTNRDLQAYARKVTFYGEMRQQMHEEINRLQSLRQSIDEEIINLEEKLNTVGEDAQLANVDMQNVLQKQQQTLQMMSHISKLLYDTAMAVIRKIGG